MIRTLESRDAAAWAALRGRLWPDAAAEDLFHEVRAYLEGGQGAMLDAVFVGEDAAHQLSGFIELSIRDFADGCDSMPVPHVEGWYVEPGSRGRGVGKALMERAAAWARERGFSEIASDTEVENVASQGAHAHCGFEETERLVKFRRRLD